MPLHAQSARELAKQVMDSYAAHQEPVDALRKSDALGASKMADAFMPYLKDQDGEVRRQALQNIHRVAVRRGDEDLQKKVVREMVQLLNDKEAPVVNNAVQFLDEYPPRVFDTESRYLLSQRAKEKKTAQNKVVMLTGYLGISELAYDYRQMLNDPAVKNKSLRLSLQLASARMGDTASVRELLILANKAKVNDDFVWDFCPDLAYTCQKPVYNFLFSIILSDKKDCLSANPDSEKPVICAYRVIETIAPYIKNFPVPLDSSGEADIRDYPATLATVREWIKQHGEELEFTVRY